jgi:hypothetical protein
MIVEVVAGCFTVCFVATLRFAKWATERSLKSDPIAVRVESVRWRRHELERQYESIARQGFSTDLGADVVRACKDQKDRRIVALGQQLEELSQLEAQILRGE